LFAVVAYWAWKLAEHMDNVKTLVQALREDKSST
jgi:hypothetical protein